MMNQMAEEIKALCLQERVPVFGTTESSHLEKEPKGYRPSDALPSARSMLCLGIPVPKGVFQSGGRSTENYWRTANIYYRHLDTVLLQAARLLEEQGEVALPVFG